MDEDGMGRVGGGKRDNMGREDSEAGRDSRGDNLYIRRVRLAVHCAGLAARANAHAAIAASRDRGWDVSGLDGRARDGWTRQRGTRYPSVNGLTGQPKTGQPTTGRRSSVAHREGGDYGRLSIHPPG
ncbi:hypothetical protein B0H16DRAFT_1703888 [Mycena metata]|uniref:Uncharacterized protein n=1 Tax=Mycena metata TaxID=1033252 RepID=A0AAD7H038_9AGAR|nr:hypothetical protein B0H16DRAFT_1703888 [Mycena metata]